mmetsp:Transcript_23638/g.32364  ORF Transcript_23638/g.32364 Transcript_23638/m.32364 type:complete len:168 (+) Transcript_23638:340-843(+)
MGRLKAETAKAIAAQEKKVLAALRQNENNAPPVTKRGGGKMNNGVPNQLLVITDQSESSDDCSISHNKSSLSLKGNGGCSTSSVNAKKQKGNGGVRNNAVVDAVEMERGLQIEMKAFLSSVVGELKSVIQPISKERKKKHCDSSDDGSDDGECQLCMAIGLFTDYHM